ncbi:cation:proton antiporter [Stappia sp. F7233]|uniref:Cation:proton antiporter n=1 Tax=Stappia albiluteola TaxID=2758565 RepID=A0A839AGV7_9HYPH|nr:monovalent cation:proton antiporter-2 (CPA2) family protein [Stappia albiluteola]MBA5778375.1 cation:proton antiporter [Stappia albiluteola]
MAAEAAPPIFTEAIVFLSAAVIAVPLFKRLGLGSVVGFLAAGIAIGPFGFDVIPDPGEILSVAEIGVVLLLFVIGLELEPARLWRMKGDIFGLGTTQVLACGAALTACLLLAGGTAEKAVIGGFGLALSSTAFALQILQERGQLSTNYGQRAFGILLLQDMAIVPLLALVPMLAPSQTPTSVSGIFNEIGITAAAVAGVIFAGRYLLTPIFSFLAASRAREVMLAAALLVALGSAGVMHAAGLSMALGAFLAGVMLAESSFRPTLEADIEPFRSLFMGLFFISIGMVLDIGLLLNNIWLVAAGVLLVMGVKGVLLWLISRLFGSSNSDALKIAVTLPQGGEFAFVLFTSATVAGIFDRPETTLLIAIVILTMLCTPLACTAHDLVATRMQRRGADTTVIEEFSAAKPTVLVVGFGRFGMVVAQMLTSDAVAITAIDLHPDRIRYARKLGYKVYYGDATRADILTHAGAGDAVLIALCIENEQVMARAIDVIRAHFPTAKLYCRATDRAHALDLTKRGVDFQIRETFESGIAFGRAALDALGIEGERIIEIETDVRRRDKERLELQLKEGLFAGADRLHQVTPRTRDAGGEGGSDD